MIYQLIDFLTKLNFINYLFFTGVLIVFFIKFSNNICSFLKLSEYSAIQKIHQEKYRISREGGLSLFLGISLFWYINYQLFSEDFNLILGYIMFFSFPLLIAGVLEDFYQNVKPVYRLLSIFLSAFLFLYFQEYGYPSIEIPFLEFINDNEIILLVVFTIAIATLCNGMNIIDGTNGLASTNSIAALGSISFLSYIVSDFELLKISIMFASFLLIFLIFNYPWGKIFLGDFGAYFFGWTISILLILLFARHPQLPTWNAVLVIFYPSFEVIFSYARKMLSGKSPMLADGEHFHLKLYFLLLSSIKRKRVANCLVLPFICIFWLLPPMSIPWIYTHVELILFLIFILIFFYISIYYFLPKKNND